MINTNGNNTTEDTKDPCRPGRFLTYALTFMFALGTTSYLYWPVYKTIKLSDTKLEMASEFSRLNLPIGDDIKEILDRKIDLPRDRHELCMKNMNGFHLVHADSNTPGVPFNFYTDDLNRGDYGRENKLGAMSVRIFFSDGVQEAQIYREFGQPKECIVLDSNKLKKYASSTVEYRFMGLSRVEELSLGTGEKLGIQRQIVGGYSVETAKSSLYIEARWNYFALTLLALFLIFQIVFAKYITYTVKHSCFVFNKFLIYFKKYTHIK